VTSAHDSPRLTRDDVDEVIERRLRRFIRGHAGDVTVEDVTPDGEVHLRFQGACRSCPLINTTFAMSVYPALRELEGVRRVTADGVTITDRALQRIDSMFGEKTPGGADQ
jgi:Fe-S cluster biogenesis protein NfuA